MFVFVAIETEEGLWFISPFKKKKKSTLFCKPFTARHLFWARLRKTLILFSTGQRTTAELTEPLLLWFRRRHSPRTIFIFNPSTTEDPSSDIPLEKVSLKRRASARVHRGRGTSVTHALAAANSVSGETRATLGHEEELAQRTRQTAAWKKSTTGDKQQTFI